MSVITGLVGIFFLVSMLFDEPNVEALLAVPPAAKGAEDISALQGRLYMWSGYFEFYLRNPVIGQGFAALSTSLRLLPGDPHNSNLSVLLGTRIIASLVVTVGGLRLAFEFARATGSHVFEALRAAAATIAVLINSLAMPLVWSGWEESSLVYSSLAAVFLLFGWLPYRRVVGNLCRTRGAIREATRLA